MSKQHVVVDLETTSNNPFRGRILTVGAVVGDPKSGEISDRLHIAVSVDDLYNVREQDCPDTVEWWHEVADSGDQGYRAYMVAWHAHDLEVLHIEDALIRLNEFFTANKAEYLWANGPSFDMSYLERFYRTFNIECSIPYHKVRDMRTVMHLAAQHGVYKNAEEYWDGLVNHVAVDDAEGEFRMLSAAWQKLN